MGHELTKNDIKKMEEEIEYRIHEVRKAALDDVKETRAHGDLSENFEYHAAKRFKNKNESRIRYLQRTIKNELLLMILQQMMRLVLITLLRCSMRTMKVQKLSRLLQQSGLIH